MRRGTSKPKSQKSDLSSNAGPLRSPPVVSAVDCGCLHYLRPSSERAFARADSVSITRTSEFSRSCIGCRGCRCSDAIRRCLPHRRQRSGSTAGQPRRAPSAAAAFHRRVAVPFNGKHSHRQRAADARFAANAITSSSAMRMSPMATENAWAGADAARVRGRVRIERAERVSRDSLLPLQRPQPGQRPIEVLAPARRRAVVAAHSTMGLTGLSVRSGRDPSLGEYTLPPTPPEQPAARGPARTIWKRSCAAARVRPTRRRSSTPATNCCAASTHRRRSRRSASEAVRQINRNASHNACTASAALSPNSTITALVGVDCPIGALHERRDPLSAARTRPTQIPPPEEQP